MRESVIENYLKDLAQSLGWRSYKWVSPGLRGVPDQIVLAYVPPEHRALVARYVRFAEVKAPGEKARGQQSVRHTELCTLGFAVDVVDSKFDVRDLIEVMGP